MKFVKLASLIITIIIVVSYIYIGIYSKSGDIYSYLSRYVVLIAVGWFTYRTFNLFINESINEKNQQGSIPILAMVYTFASLFFYLLFFKSFGDIISVSDFKIRMALNCIDDYVPLYVIGIRGLTSLALVAFSFNMMKAIFTLNSLEFGFIYNKTLKTVFGDKQFKVFLEAFLRFLIALAFINLEYTLNASSYIVLTPLSSNALSFQEPSNYLLIIGCWVSLLYTLLLSWLGIIFKFLDYEMNLDIEWYKNSFRQFMLGLIIGFVFILLGSPLKKEIYLITLVAGILSCLSLIYYVIKNEIINLRNGASHSV